MSFAISLVATGVAIRAISRDGPDLRLTLQDAGMGNRWLRVVNVGLRPVRIENVVVRTGGPWPLGRVVRIEADIARHLGDAGSPPPVILQPGEDVVLHYTMIQPSFDPSGLESPLARGERVMIQDAAGRLYRVQRGVGPDGPAFR